MTSPKTVLRNDLIYPELSYKIVGLLFDAYNELGGGLKEEHYQRAMAVHLRDAGLKFKEQVVIPVKAKEQGIGNYRLDFLIEDIIVLEIKRGDNFRRTNIKQVKEYLEVTGLKLGIIANFSSEDLKYRRIVNIN
jgi:GxxExxY protein